MLEGGDRTVGIGEGGLKMCKALCLRPARRSGRQFGRQFGRRTARRKCRAHFALAQVESIPDALPGSLAAPAVGDDSACSSDAAGHGMLQEFPQRAGGHAQPSDFVRDPDAEGPTAAAPPIAVAAIDAPSADRWSPAVAFVVATQKAMAIQRANGLAMRTRRLLESFSNRVPFRLAAEKPALFAHDRSAPRENR